MLIETTACFSGYRPAKLPWGEDEGDPRCAIMKLRLVEQITAAYERGYRTFISGMAQGVDTYAAEAVTALSAIFPDIGLVCAIPFPGFPLQMKRAQRERYERVILKCERCHVLEEAYTPSCMMARNRFMVDNSSLLIAVYDGQSGGTRNTVNYAKEKGRDIWFITPR